MTTAIIGGGLAGLTTALSLAPRPVTIICSGKLDEQASSLWAQGGLAAAMGDGDTPALHAADTIKAGNGLCDKVVVDQITAAAPDAVRWLEQQGAVFDKTADNKFALGLEGAHGHRRVLHAGGDQTGLRLTKALIRAVKNTPSIQIIENCRATHLLSDGQITGIVVTHNNSQDFIAANNVVLATGGAGALWQDTTNPVGSWGSGLYLAAHVGAALGDLEFMQFHPTAIVAPSRPAGAPMPLASEALRGEGAILIDNNGNPVMAGHAKGDLEPRDIVARVLWQHKMDGTPTYLDARTIRDLPTRFPAVMRLCQEFGLDPTTMPIPVCPAAHYHMGGVITDLNGQTTINGLWACGEVASTGLHGANRLASNSLLEAVVIGRRVAEAIGGSDHKSLRTPAPRMPSPITLNPDVTKFVRQIMSTYVGVARDQKGLATAVEQLTPLSATSPVAMVALFIATAALWREETRGAHIRSDFPAANSLWQRRQTLTLHDITKKKSNAA